MISARHSWFIAVRIMSRARFEYTLRVWLESVVTTNLRLRTHRQVVFAHQPVKTRFGFTFQPRSAATRASCADCP